MPTHAGIFGAVTVSCNQPRTNTKMTKSAMSRFAAQSHQNCLTIQDQNNLAEELFIEVRRGGSGGSPYRKVIVGGKQLEADLRAGNPRRFVFTSPAIASSGRISHAISRRPRPLEAL